uniref:Ig-like domain-containing protein n=1 Tax=Callorhinchus milii TaxID=7868 RepID=A0A4W3JU11_CALMI
MCVSLSDGSVALSQPRLSLTSKLNKTVQIPCIIDSKTLNTDFVHWYRKSADKKLQWILYFQNQQKKEIDSAFKARFFVEKVEQTKSCNLIILDTREADTGVYYCWGEGMDRTLQKPVTSLPSEMTFQFWAFVDTEFLLVCLITGFYPDVIKVYWKPDGEQSKWETDPVEKENGETSYVISRFNVTQLQWKNSKVICGVQHESSKDNIEPSCFCMTIRFCMSYFYFLFDLIK